MWTFEDPFLLVVLLVVPFLIWLRHGWKGRGGRLDFPIATWSGAPFVPLQPGLRLLRSVAAVSFWTAFACLLVALAGPGLLTRDKIFLSPGTDTMIVLDESPSMAARDVPPESRFTAAQRVIEDFVKSRENDPVGLVTFGKTAALRVPPTLDYKFFLDDLHQRRIMEMGDGTALGMGIALATLHLQNSLSPQKVIIVLTDGENNAGEIEPETAADIARNLGISLYVIGLGTPGQVPIDVTDPATGKAFSGTLEGGFNEDLLKKISGGREGTYFTANSAGSLQSVFLSIDSRETVGKRVKIQVNTIPLYPHFLLGAFLLFLLFLGVRKGALQEIL